MKNKRFAKYINLSSSLASLFLRSQLMLTLVVSDRAKPQSLFAKTSSKNLGAVEASNTTGLGEEKGEFGS